MVGDTSMKQSSRLPGWYQQPISVKDDSNGTEPTKQRLTAVSEASVSQPALLPSASLSFMSFLCFSPSFLSEAEDSCHREGPSDAGAN